jgi:glycosyltransferase involved in cell wall biosynthesis
MPHRVVNPLNDIPPCDFPLAVIICTRSRPQSLKRTLESLATADRTRIALRVIVVNNSTSNENEPIVLSLQSKLPVCLVNEAQAGKASALNRGLLEIGEAEIVAVLDDDMTVHPRWCLGVRQLTERWPEKGFFTGSESIIWPQLEVPAWARDPYMAAWAFSVLGVEQDQMIAPGHWASGNHFWFRAKLLPKGFRFFASDRAKPQPVLEMAEPRLMLDLAEQGYGGVIGPDAVAWHHVQANLLNVDVQRQRAIMVGRTFAELRLIPYRKSVKQAVLFNKYPLLSRIFCFLNSLRWLCLYVLAKFSYSSDKQIVRTFRALERMTTYRQYLKICQGVKEYQIRIPFIRYAWHNPRVPVIQ